MKHCRIRVLLDKETKRKYMEHVNRKYTNASQDIKNYIVQEIEKERSDCSDKESS